MIREGARLLHRANEPLDDLLGHTPVPAEVGGFLTHLAEEALEGSILHVERSLVGKRCHDRLEVTACAIAVVKRRRPPLTLEQQLQAAGEALDLRDSAYHTDVV